jgi:hypothetical protein
MVLMLVAQRACADAAVAERVGGQQDEEAPAAVGCGRAWRLSCGSDDSGKAVHARCEEAQPPVLPMEGVPWSWSWECCVGYVLRGWMPLAKALANILVGMMVVTLEGVVHPVGGVILVRHPCGMGFSG